MTLELLQTGVGVVKRRNAVVLRAEVVGTKVVVVFAVTTGSTVDTGKVVFGTGDVVIGLTVVIEVAGVVAKGI